MKIAVFSDIHGNMFALKAVLEDMKQFNVERIFCLGDLAMAGPEPLKAIDKIKDLMQNPDFTIIQGNTDEMLSVFSFDIFNKIVEVNEVMGQAYLADSKLLNDEYKSFLASLPKTKEIEISGIIMQASLVIISGGINPIGMYIRFSDECLGITKYVDLGCLICVKIAGVSAATCTDLVGLERLKSATFFKRSLISAMFLYSSGLTLLSHKQ